MSFRTIVAYLACLCVVALALVEESAGTDNPASIFQGRENAWAAALHAGDIPALAAMYEPGAWLVVPGTPPFKGSEAVRAALGVLKQQTAHVMLSISSAETIARDCVIENGTATMLAPGDLPGAAKHANYQVIWHRNAKDEWKIMRDIVSPG